MADAKKVAAGSSALAEAGQQAIQKVTPEAVRQMTDGVVLHEHDIRLPWLRLAQAQSEQGTAGKFVRSDTNEEFDTIEVVVVRVQAVRSKYPPGKYEKGRKLECASYDGFRAIATFMDGRAALHPGAECLTCKDRAVKPWEAKADEGRCMPNYITVVALAETMQPILMHLSGTKAKLAKVFGATGTIRNAVLRLSAKIASGNTGKYYVVDIKVVRKVTEQEKATIMAVFAETQVSAETASVPEDSSSEEQTPNPDPESNSAQARAQGATFGGKAGAATVPTTEAKTGTVLGKDEGPAKPGWAILDQTAKIARRKGKVVSVDEATLDPSGVMYAWVKIKVIPGDKEARLLLVDDTADTVTRLIKPDYEIEADGYGYTFADGVVLRVVGTPSYKAPAGQQAKVEEDLPF